MIRKGEKREYGKEIRIKTIIRKSKGDEREKGKAKDERIVENKILWN